MLIADIARIDPRSLHHLPFCRLSIRPISTLHISYKDHQGREATPHQYIVAQRQLNIDVPHISTFATRLDVFCATFPALNGLT